MTRNEFTLLILLVALVALAVFATVGIATEHAFSHLFDHFSMTGATQ